MFICVCLLVCIHTHKYVYILHTTYLLHATCMKVPMEARWGHQIPQKVAVDFSVWDLRIKPEFSVRVASVLNHWAIPLTPQKQGFLTSKRKRVFYCRTTGLPAQEPCLSHSVKQCGQNSNPGSLSLRLPAGLDHCPHDDITTPSLWVQGPLLQLLCKLWQGFRKAA